MKSYTLYPALLLMLLLSACNTQEKLVYLQEAGSPADFAAPGTVVPVPDPILKVGDLLVITINSETPEAAAPFNLPLIPSATTGVQNYNPTRSTISSYSGGLQNYLVDTEGNITLPVLGTLQVAGKSKLEVSRLIHHLLYPRYMTEEPIVLIRFANFRVSILGEVLRPGNFSVENDKITIFEAIALAGDLTLYGRRDNVLLIREGVNGRETIRIDLRDKRLLESPYYFLQQSDVLYVQTNDPRSRNSAIGAVETLSISIVGTLISLTTLLINIVK